MLTGDADAGKRSEAMFNGGGSSSTRRRGGSGASTRSRANYFPARRICLTGLTLFNSQGRLYARPKQRVLATPSVSGVGAFSWGLS